MNFLTTGEKIRSLRKRMGMRQQELEDAKITRAFISMIENGKRGLSRDTANIIAEKLNNKAKSIGVEINVDEDYLLRTPGEDAEIYCNEKLNNFPTNDEIDVIIHIAKSYALIKVEAIANKILGDYSFKVKRNTEAFIYYLISLDLYKDTDEKTIFSYLYYRLGLCKFNQLDYVEAISFFRRASDYLRLYEDCSIEKVNLLSMALTYKNLGNNTEYLKYTQKYLSKCDKIKDVNEYAKASILKCDCFSSMGNRDKAISLIDDLMEELNIYKDRLVCEVYMEAAKLYLKEGYYDNSLKYIQLAEDAVNNVDNINLASVYFIKGKIYLAEKLIDEALSSTNRCLKLCSEDEKLMLEAHNILIGIYSSQKDFINLKNTYIKLLDILKDKDYYREEVLKLYNKLALLYLEQNDIEMCKKYLNIVS